MFLVHRGTQNPNRWEVAWTWLPYFLAADQILHRFVDKKMTERWRGCENPGLHEVRQMHEMVIDLIVERYPIEGLKGWLSSIAMIRAEDGVIPTPPEVKTEEARLEVLRKEAAEWDESAVTGIPPPGWGDSEKVDPGQAPEGGDS